jgi:TonB-linked SusC/RagA family outer membrane protein
MKRPILSFLKTIGLSLALMLVSQNAMAQYSLTVDGGTVKQAISQLQRSSGYSFFFTDELPDLGSAVTVSLSDTSLDNILKALFAGSQIDYRIQENDKQVVLVKRQQPSVVNITVTGTVTSPDGLPIGGATVVSSDGRAATVTDGAGKYSVTTAQNSSLTFSFLGYTSQTIEVHQGRTLDVALDEDAQIIDDVVVIGYGEVRRGDITTAVSVVSTKDIDERPIVSATEMMQGRAPGVQIVTPSGQPGASQMVRVRGATSITASNDPLYVVDGITMDDIGHLSPGDIATMQVLKDASSAAIYGARAANGVILITTKRGQSGNAVVKLSSYVGLSQLGKNIDALTTDEYKELMGDLAANGVMSIPAPEDIPDQYTDWSQELFRTGVEQNHQLSIQNGTDKLQYYVSAGYTDMTGIVYNSSFQRANFRANIDAQQTKWLKMNMNVAYTNSQQQSARQNSSSMRAGSIMSVINTPPYMGIWSKENPGQYDENALGNRIMNPLAANAYKSNWMQDRIVGSLGLTVTPVKGLDIRSMFGIDLNLDRSTDYLDPTSTVDGRASKGSYSESFGRNYQWQWDNTINYATTFGEKHNLSAMAGALLSHAQWNGINAGGTDLYMGSNYAGNLQAIDLVNRIENGAGGSGSAWALASFVGRVMYDYDKKYLLTVNMRADGSSRFRPEQRWGYFPSVSAGWRISGEEFMEGTEKVVSDLKLRVAWGSNGNQGGIGNYSYLTFYNLSRQISTSENPYPGFAISNSTMPNDRITWETTTQWNAGVDASLFNSRLNLTVDAYVKKTSNLILRTSLPEHVGGLSLTRNEGEMLNKGMEFYLQGRIFTGKFKWDSDFNLSFNRNQVTKLGLMKSLSYAGTYTTGEPAIMLKEGWDLGTFFGYTSLGVNPETGDITYADLDGDGEITTNDRGIIGSAQPDFIYGFTNTFSYAGFNLSIFFQGSQGNEIFNATRIETEGMMDFRNQSKEVLRRWRRPGWETDIPRPGNAENIHNSTRFVEDGSYLRLKNLTLSYSFTGKWMQKVRISRLQPYFTAQNLLTFTKYSGYDPEVSAYGTSSTSMGVDFGTYPQNKTFIFGLNIEF